MQSALVVAWHNPKQIAEFKEAWKIQSGHQVYFQQDKDKEGCAVTKNKGIRRAYDDGAEMIVVLDDDCYPKDEHYTLQNLFEDYESALKPQKVLMYYAITQPRSRGTPYLNRTIQMPVAAALGYALKFPDLDAASSLVLGSQIEIGMLKQPIHGRYFSGCGMNFAFRREWIDCVQFINIPRFDDIWMFLIFQKIAYAKGFCFSLEGPDVIHQRQSNIWRNLQDEVKYLEINETLWQTIHAAPSCLSASELRDKLFLSYPRT
jgi:hypothetical protein